MRLRSRIAARTSARPPLVLLGVAVAVAASACASSSSSGSGGQPGRSTPPGASLEGTDWVLTGSVLGVPLTGVTVTARFEGGSVTGNGGCNSYSGRYTVSGSTLTIGPNIASTQMACGPAQTAVEQAYLARLPKTAGYRVSGQTLTLVDSGGATLLEFAPAPTGPDALAGKWTVISYYTGSAVTSVIGGATLTAEFGAEDVSGNGGCNTFSGPYKAGADGSIAIGPLATTLMACAKPELQNQEEQYVHALQLATTYKVTGNRLDLFRPGNVYAVTMQRA